MIFNKVSSNRWWAVGCNCIIKIFGGNWFLVYNLDDVYLVEITSFLFSLIKGFLRHNVLPILYSIFFLFCTISWHLSFNFLMNNSLRMWSLEKCIYRTSYLYSYLIIYQQFRNFQLLKKCFLAAGLVRFQNFDSNKF